MKNINIVIIKSLVIMQTWRPGKSIIKKKKIEFPVGLRNGSVVRSSNDIVVFQYYFYFCYYLNEKKLL